jgi:hypothetical protein
MYQEFAGILAHAHVGCGSVNIVSSFHEKSGINGIDVSSRVN